MEHFIVTMIIGVGALYVLYHVAMVLYFFGFGDDGFTWRGLGYLLVTLTMFSVLGVAAWFLGSVILGVVS
jgi:hypothetical protein